MSNTLIKEIIDFVLKECSLYGEIDRPCIENYITQHIFYHSLMVRTDEKGIVGVARWNIVNDVIKVLDTVIRKDKRNTDLLKKMLTSVWYQHPWLEWVAYEKRQSKKYKAYRIHKFLSRRV